MSAILAGSLAGTGAAFAGSPAADRAQPINPEEVGKREDGQSKFVEATPLQQAKMRTLIRGSKFIGTLKNKGTNTVFGKVKDAAFDLHSGRIDGGGGAAGGRGGGDRRGAGPAGAGR